MNKNAHTTAIDLAHFNKNLSDLVESAFVQNWMFDRKAIEKKRSACPFHSTSHEMDQRYDMCSKYGTFCNGQCLQRRVDGE